MLCRAFLTFSCTNSMNKMYVRRLTQLAHRKYLPGSEGPGFPKFLRPPREDFPKIVDWRELGLNKAGFSGNTYIAQLGQKIRETVNQLQDAYPALLFKNLPIRSNMDLDRLFSGMGYDYLDYVGGAAVRSQVTAKISTASREPKEMCIELHNEMCYQPTWPKQIMFYCEVAPPLGTGGETVIADVRDIEAGLDKEIVQKFNRLGVEYIRNLPDKYTQNAWYHSWQESFLTDSREEVERALSALGATFQWHQDGRLTTHIVLPAKNKHHRTGEEIWFNQAQSHHASYLKYNPAWACLNFSSADTPFHTTYGDGSEIEKEVLQHIRDVSWRVSVGWQMEGGDLLLLDNMYVQHARLSFTGERKLLVSLVKMDPVYFREQMINI